jgi:hypothetical protein
VVTPLFPFQVIMAWWAAGRVHAVAAVRPAWPRSRRPPSCDGVAGFEPARQISQVLLAKNEPTTTERGGARRASPGVPGA